jgi:hypothetical protein
MRRIFLAIGLSIWLSGCGLTSMLIKSDTLSFDDTIEDTTNKLLLLNVLRARDKAPLHFVNIPVIRESMQELGSLGFTKIFGTKTGTTLRNSTAGNISFQAAPSFELTHLQSKDFFTGLSSPIDTKFVKYWLDRGLDRRIVLLLFFSAVEIVETRSETGPINTIKIMNSPREVMDAIKNRQQPFSGPEELRCDTQPDFLRYLRLINKLKTFFANTYRERRVLAKGMNLDPDKDSKNLQAFAALDQTKVELVYDKGLAAYNLYALPPEQKVALCFYEDKGAGESLAPEYEFIQAGPTPVSGKSSCFQSLVDAPAEDSTKPKIGESPILFKGPADVKKPSPYCEIYNKFIGESPVTKVNGYPKLELRLHIRSVGEMFQFLGDLLQYQDEAKQYLESHRQFKLKLNTPVTFGYCGDDPSPGCDDIFFRLDGDPCNARFTLMYRGQQYSVANLNPPNGTRRQDASCRSDYPYRPDHTLEILSIVHQLVNLHKSATDIRATPAVEVIP